MKNDFRLSEKVKKQRKEGERRLRKNEGRKEDGYS